MPVRPRLWVRRAAAYRKIGGRFVVFGVIFIHMEWKMGKIMPKVLRIFLFLITFAGKTNPNQLIKTT